VCSSDLSFRTRMRIYKQETVPAIADFRRNSPVISLNVTNHDIEKNYSRLKAALDSLLKRWLGTSGQN
jgi:hypothetical protein